MRKPSRQIGDRVMKLLTTFILLTICLTAIGQTSPTRKWVDTEVKYTDSGGKVVMIHNSFPKAGGDADEKCRYTDSSGKKYRYVIFWTRVINETATPLELTINFPAILPSPYSHIKLFVPSDTMTSDKNSLYNYGITGLKSYLETDFNKTMLKRTINPKEESLFYIVLLSPLYSVGGTVRTGFVLKEHQLFYRISIRPNFDTALIPCGQIAFKKSRR
ncbi:hypothetical protein [Chryseolinea sp. H1M3-3]|uniref:hypothetical protein n=1 Tax=Chryseolinea sp. H1M3-3 TaxID=3034144 RepID=UPI0023ED0377|nr:hypothetical protein [Chryseolinea sp. H1M3-3]